MRTPPFAALAAIAAAYLVSPSYAQESQTTSPSTTTTAAPEKAPAKTHDCAKTGHAADPKCAHASAVKGSEHTHMGEHSPAAQPAGPSGPATKATPASPATSSKPATSVTYVCPMHPEVTSDKKGRCPKCGMTLEVKK